MEETVQSRPEYEPPQIVSYTQEEILEQLGPAQTLYGGVQGSY
jgi:hypothetical protein